MNHPRFTADLTVDQALGVSRSIPGVFVSHRTACVGCYLSRFCTLRDATKTYELDLESFLDELRQAALADPINELGAKDEEFD